MKTTTEKLENAINQSNIRDSKKFKEQQAYYKRLVKEGVAVKQTYNLKSIAAI